MKIAKHHKRWRWVPRSRVPMGRIPMSELTNPRSDKREVSFIARGQTVNFQARRKPTPGKLAERRLRRQGNKLAKSYKTKGLPLPKKICIKT